jgi:hypothetical protein
VLALACFLATPARADAPSLAAAEATYARGALREAQRAFQSLLREPSLDRATLARVHLHLGILAGASGAERTASGHFAIALALEPALETPPELAGRDRARFERARQADALAIVAATADAGAVEARVTGAPPGLVESLTLTCGDEVVATSAPPRPETLRATVPPEHCAVVHVTARDVHGHVLAHREVPRGRAPEATP